MTSPRKPQRRKDARPAEIMEAGLKTFAENGFAATRLEDVAKAAGISKATIYLYFESKTDLLKAILMNVVSPRMGEMEQMVKNYDGPATDLLKLIYAHASTTIRSPDVRPLLKLILAEAGYFPEIAEFYRREVAFRALYTLAGLIEHGIRRGEFSPCNAIATAQSVVFPLLMNVIASEVLGPMPEFDPDKFVPSHLDFVLRGLAAGREA